MIGGNTNIELQVKTTVKNEIGEAVKTWKTVQTLPGWLDFSSGEAKYNNFNAKIQESTHIFIGDYAAIDPQITAENSRAIVEGSRYDVLFIDDPMGRHRQIEIYLKYTGGQP